MKAKEVSKLVKNDGKFHHLAITTKKGIPTVWIDGNKADGFTYDCQYRFKTPKGVKE